MRSARVAIAAAVACAPAAVAALPARAAECVRVAVDYGTMPGAPAGPNTTCVSPSGTAAEVLHERARQLRLATSQYPRYRGNFLCAIDGYPGDNECGDHGTEPYWSFWLWVDGSWTYSSLGVDTYTVRDADKDGRPDPMGFRYHEFSKRQPPRTNPSYPKPTTPPPSRPAPTSAAPAPPRAGTTRAVTSPGARATQAPSPGTTAAAATGAPAPGTTATASPLATPAAGATAAGAPAAGAGGEGVVTGAAPPRAEPEAFPLGLVVGGAAALALLGATAVKMRGAS